MAAQYLTGWNPRVVVAAHNLVVTEASVGTNPPTVTIHSGTDVLLATITMTDPIGIVNPTTGVITCSQAAREESAPSTGTASYASIRDGNGDVLRSIPCQQGNSPVYGYCVLNTLEIATGVPVELISLTIA
jgi:hypothetical protein